MLLPEGGGERVVEWLDLGHKHQAGAEVFLRLQAVQAEEVQIQTASFHRGVRAGGFLLVGDLETEGPVEFQCLGKRDARQAGDGGCHSNLWWKSQGQFAKTNGSGPPA